MGRLYEQYHCSTWGNRPKANLLSKQSLLPRFLLRYIWVMKTTKITPHLKPKNKIWFSRSSFTKFLLSNKGSTGILNSFMAKKFTQKMHWISTVYVEVYLNCFCTSYKAGFYRILSFMAKWRVLNIVWLRSQSGDQDTAGQLSSTTLAHDGLLAGTTLDDASDRGPEALSSQSEPASLHLDPLGVECPIPVCILAYIVSGVWCACRCYHLVHHSYRKGTEPLQWRHRLQARVNLRACMSSGHPHAVHGARHVQKG